MMTTYGWLVALERRRIIPDADTVFAEIRGLAAPLVPTQTIFRTKQPFETP